MSSLTKDFQAALLWLPSMCRFAKQMIGFIDQDHGYGPRVTDHTFETCIPICDLLDGHGFKSTLHFCSFMLISLLFCSSQLINVTYFGPSGRLCACWRWWSVCWYCDAGTEDQQHWWIQRKGQPVDAVDVAEGHRQAVFSWHNCQKNRYPALSCTLFYAFIHFWCKTRNPLPIKWCVKKKNHSFSF